MRLRSVPLELKEANAFIDKTHRHHDPVHRDKYRLGCEIDGKLVGVVQVGRPVARALCDGKTLEVVRLNSEKKSFLAEFSRRAVQRLQDKKVPKYRTLHIPSLATDMRFRNLSYDEITECMNMEDTGDPNRSDKYCIYLAAVEPSLKDVAKEIMESESSLPADQRTLLEPLDVVGIFDIGEVQEIAMQVMELSGVLNSTKVTVVDQLKN